MVGALRTNYVDNRDTVWIFRPLGFLTYDDENAGEVVNSAPLEPFLLVPATFPSKQLLRTLISRHHNILRKE
jgi:hypothetical protein